MHSASSAEYIVNQVKRHKRAAIVTLAVCWFWSWRAMLIYAWRLRQTSGGGQHAISSIAVLPFVNVNADPDTEYLSDGITDNIIDRLSRLPNLKVMAHTAVFHYKGNRN